MLPSETVLVLEAAVVGYATYMGSLRLAQRVSPYIAGYRKMPKTEQLEWDARIPSTVHAVAITAATIHLFLFSSVFSEDHAGDRPFVLRTSPLSAGTLGFSVGYFATDLVLLALHYPNFGGLEMGVHHVAALASVAAAALQGQAHAYTLALLATECTTPFVNARYMLDKGGWRDHPMYTANGVALMLSWLVARILLFLRFFHHVALHLHEFHLLSLASRCLIYTVPPTLFVLNVLWFAKIVRGVIKLLRRKPTQPGAGLEQADVPVKHSAAGGAAALERKEL